MTAATASLGRRESVDLAATIIMLVLTASWGLNGVAAKLSYSGFDPIFASVARSTIGGILVFLWARYRGVKLFDRDGTLLPGLLAGLLFAGEFVMIYVGLEYTSAARGALMLNTMPFWVLLGAYLLLGERVSTTKLAGLALAFGGVVLVFSDKLSALGPDAIIGDLMNFVGGALWATTTLVIKGTRLNSAPAEKVLLYQLSVSAVVGVPLLAFTGPVLRDVTWLPVGALLFQAIYVVAVTYVVWFWLMTRYPAAGLSSFAFLTPAFGVLFGTLILHEPFSMRILAALALIGIGLVLVNRPQTRKALS